MPGGNIRIYVRRQHNTLNPIHCGRSTAPQHSCSGAVPIKPLQIWTASLPAVEDKHQRRNQPWPCLGGSLAMDKVEYRTEMYSNEVRPSHTETIWYHDDTLRQGLLTGPAHSPPYLVCQKANLLMQIYINQNANSSCKVEMIPLTYTYIK